MKLLQCRNKWQYISRWVKTHHLPQKHSKKSPAIAIGSKKKPRYKNDRVTKVTGFYKKSRSLSLGHCKSIISKSILCCCRHIKSCLQWNFWSCNRKKWRWEISLKYLLNPSFLVLIHLCKELLGLWLSFATKDCLKITSLSLWSPHLEAPWDRRRHCFSDWPDLSLSDFFPDFLSGRLVSNFMPCAPCAILGSQRAFLAV